MEENPSVLSTVGSAVGQANDIGANEQSAFSEQAALEFRGGAKEYFRIWVVNFALTLLTLGVYSAWAKVRNKRYIYGSTFLAGHSFDFHADPWRILWGRLIVVVLFLGYFLGSLLSPYLSFGSLAVLLLFLPWAIVRGMIFNLGNTSYRNVRFGFEKDYSGSYRTYGISFLLLICSFGLAFPWVMRRHWHFRVSRSRFGTRPFRFTADGGDFFGIYFVAGSIYVGGFLLGVAATLVFPRSIAGGLTVTCIYCALLLSAAHVRAQTANLVARHSSLGRVTFRSSMRSLDFFYIYVTNLLACLFTLGLAVPWAVVRMHRYRLAHLGVWAPAGEADTFVATERESHGAMADAALDFWDFDLGF